MNCSPRTLTAVLALGAFAVSGVAQAAPAKPSVSAGNGALSGSSVGFTVKNRSAFAVRGQVALSAGKVAAGKRGYRAGAGKSARVSVPLGKAARSALAKKGSLRLTVKTSAKGGGKTVVRTSSLTVRKPAAGKAPAAQPNTQLAPSSTGPSTPAAGGKAPANPGGGTPGGGNPGGGDPEPQPQPAPVEWRGGDIIGGKYDDFTFTTDAGKLTLTSVPSFNVTCVYTSGASRGEVTAAESFTEAGPFTLGDQNAAKTKSATLNNSLLSGKPISATYTISTTAQDDEHITGQMKLFAYRWESSGTPGKPGYWQRSTTCNGSLPFHAIKK
jgi:hypothetical protein